MATTGGRYFGFVIGGSLPAALAANWLASAWDQNASMYVISPVTVKIEEIVMAWMVDLLRLPSGSGMGFVTGTTMANFSALAAARTALLKRAGWNVEEERAVSGVADSRRGKAGWADAYRSSVFHSLPQLQNHLSSFRSNQPQSGSGCAAVQTHRASYLPQARGLEL